MIRRKSQSNVEKEMHALKHLPGSIVGMQNILPQYGDHPKSIIFAERGMMTQVIELDIHDIKKIFLNDYKKLKALWEAILPSVSYLEKEKFK